MKFSISLFLLALSLSASFGANVSYTGRLPQDDAVELFQFNVLTTKEVTIRTLSYAGGVPSIGSVIPEGGFDPYLALFDSTGARLADNDDGAGVPASSVTGFAFDAALTQTLATGSYTLALTQVDNFSAGANLSDGFLLSGTGSFTAAFGCSNGSFCDIAGNNRTSFWAVDLQNIDSATGPPNAIPEPRSFALLVLGLAGVAYRLRRPR